MNSFKRKRILNELKTLNQIKNSPQKQDHCWFEILQVHQLQYINFIIYGPLQSPYQNLGFRVRLTWTQDYPFKSPQVRFLDSIWNPYIDSKQGKICMDILDKNWSTALTSRTILLSIISLLSQKKVDQQQQFLNIKAASQIITNYNYFFNNAKCYGLATSTKQKAIYSDNLRSIEEKIQIKEQKDEKIQEKVEKYTQKLKTKSKPKDQKKLVILAQQQQIILLKKKECLQINPLFLEQLKRKYKKRIT